MDSKEEKSKKESKTKVEKTDTKSFSKVNSKEKKEDLFASVDKEKKTPKKENEVIKGTVTINKKIEEKSKNKSKGKAGKWIALVVAVLIVVAIIVGVVFFLRTPYFAVMKSLNAMKSGNIEAINEHMSYQGLMNSLIENLQTGEEMSELEKNCFSEFTFKINTVKVEGDVATVNVDTTNKNFRNALTKWTQKIYQKFINGEDISNEEGKTLLNECLSDSTIGTISTNKDLTLNKVDDKWQLQIDENLQDAIFPGISEVVNSIDALIEE